MNIRDYMRGSVAIAPMALLALSCSAVYADTFAEDVLIGVSGGGYIYIDTEEGVVEPGMKSVTFVGTRGEDFKQDNFDIVNPYQNPITNFDDVKKRGQTSNCLMASHTPGPDANGDVYCDSVPGSGKRVKTYLTGKTPTDMRLRLSKDEYRYEADDKAGNYKAGDLINTSSVDYFSFGKLSNFTGARMTGVNIELLDKDGKPMGDLSPENAVLFKTTLTQLGLGSGMTDGLFGAGGREAETGFFDDEKAKFNLVVSDAKDVLAFGALTNKVYNEHFGNAYLDNSMVPDGIFWFNAPEDPDDEGLLIAWNNLAKGGWSYGTLALDENLEARKKELAKELGVTVEALDYKKNGLVPAEVVAAAQKNGIFGFEALEDLRNANTNYSITVGTVDGGEMILRISPKFFEIVENATSETQFKNAAYLDAVANLSYLDVMGNTEAYKAAIASLLAEDDAAKTSRALDSINFGYAPAFTSLGFETARDQVAAITRYVPWSSLNGNQEAVSNDPGSWLMGSGLYGFASQSGSRSEYDPISNTLGYDVDVYSLSLGMEKRLTGTNSSLGLAVGYTDAKAQTYQDLGKVEADGYSVAAFTRTRFGEGGLVQGLVGYQDLSYESGRNTFDDSIANGNTDGTQKFAALSIDYLKDMGAFKIGPTASVEYYKIKSDAFTETGTGIWNLDVNDQSSDVVLASIGARGEYGMNNNNTRLTGSLKYTNLSGDDLNIQTGFAGAPKALAPYTVKGMKEDLVDVSIGLDHVILSNAATKVSVYGGYNGSFGSDYESQGLQIGLNTSF